VRVALSRLSAADSRSDRQAEAGVARETTAITSTLVTACAASVWNTAPRARAMVASSEIGCRVPVSLLPEATNTNAVSAVIASARLAGFTRPDPSTGRCVTVKPSPCRLRQACSTAGCRVITCRRLAGAARAAPRTARAACSAAGSTGVVAL
jgi:hypothetical protein